MAPFDPMLSLAGGALIGLAAALLWFGLGRIAGISGILGRLLMVSPGVAADRTWQLAFVVGLVVAPLLINLAGVGLPTPAAAPLPLILVAGLAVGFGTALGSGCTSGHGICGLSRLSPRSLAAVAAFMAAGMATASLVRLSGFGG